MQNEFRALERGSMMAKHGSDVIKRKKELVIENQNYFETINS